MLEPTRRALVLITALSALLAAGPSTVAGAASPPESAAADTVVVLVFDGVAEAVLEGRSTPAFDRIRAEGSWSHGLEPPFPSVSLIGGFTLSTGCWPAHHGILSNLFLDPERGLYDHDGDADWLIGCEGMHEVAERQGMRAAVLGWYGAKSRTRGPLASVALDYGDAQTLGAEPERAAWVAEQLERNDSARPHLVLAYFSGPDTAEHYQGIESPEAAAAVEAMDAAIATVMRGIEQSGRGEKTTLVVTTDHGMRPVSHIVNAERLLHWHDVPARVVASGTTAFVYFDATATAADIDAAAKALGTYPERIEVLRKGALPAYARLGDGPRVPDLILSAKPPYYIEGKQAWPAAVRWLARIGPRFIRTFGLAAATHGYPPDVPEMRGIFYAWGAGVRAGREVAGVRSVDLHPTVMHLLGLEPGRPVDGQIALDFLQDR